MKYFPRVFGLSFGNTFETVRVYMTENDSKNTSEAKVSTSLDVGAEETGKADKMKIPSEMPVLPVRDTVVFPVWWRR